MRSPQRLARIAGLLYLVVGVCGGFAFYTRGEVYVPGDAAATARNVAAHAGLVRAGFVADLVQATFFVFLAMALYVLLRHVHRDAARAMVTFVAIAVAMMCLNMVHQFAGLLIATDPGYAAAPGSDRLVLLMLDLQYHGFLIAQIFFGLWLLPLGYLVYTSRLFPRALGVLLVAGCAGYLVDTFTRFAAPDLGAAVGPFVVAPAAVAEIAMVGWLLVRGVRTGRADLNPQTS
ncbi:hypothetical protein Lfu02_60570 [Longispora fulva]|uniref:DUF4386 domain-containing protein n=1 Tax=Longispora fulva TaxID=619741 RepID=A0A8J7KQ31_9ACTN|nr:DUF4386 domain-containing protein [Longispora fulva]MBG6136962.1 hypothetical protein [Longispora fulva]GIG61685.1 hypothetical protein Lfu02_60570 [Longispora fulva]